MKRSRISEEPARAPEARRICGDPADRPHGDAETLTLDVKRTMLIELGKSRVLLLGTLKGLVSEKEVVRSAFEDFGPDVICLHIGREEMKGLKAVVNGKVENTYLSTTEKIYAREISRFGEVQIPPPSLVEAYNISKEEGLPIRSLDFDDISYSDIYTRSVGGMTLIRQSLRIKSINKRKFRSDNPEDFVLEWDRTINRYRGFQRLELEREGRMARRIREISRKFGRVLAIIEYERMKGVSGKLSKDPTGLSLKG
ncbi:MAG: hypothetical protein ACMUHU_00330 [Thermoplasmatota archaeon]